MSSQTISRASANKNFVQFPKILMSDTFQSQRKISLNVIDEDDYWNHRGTCFIHLFSTCLIISTIYARSSSVIKVHKFKTNRSRISTQRYYTFSRRAIPSLWFRNFSMSFLKLSTFSPIGTTQFVSNASFKNFISSPASLIWSKQCQFFIYHYIYCITRIYDSTINLCRNFFNRLLFHEKQWWICDFAKKRQIW